MLNSLSSLRLFHPTQVFKSWRHKEYEPQWVFELKPSDFSNRISLTLKPAVIQKMAAMIHRDSLENPGFVFIPNLHHFTSSPEVAWDFQERLVTEIYETLKVSLGLEHEQYHVGDVIINDRGANGEVGTRGGKDIPSLHWDGGIDQLVSFMYRSKNIKGGRPMIGDAIRYLNDTGNTKALAELVQSDPRYVLRADTLFNPNAEPHPLEHYHQTIDSPAFIGDTFPIMVINNRRIDGVAHTGTTVEPQDKSQPCARLLRQIFIRTDQIPDQRILFVGPPPNEIEKSLLPSTHRNRYNHLSPDSVEHHY